MSSYEEIIQNNLKNVFSSPLDVLANKLPAELSDNTVTFTAFGELCIVKPDAVELAGEEQTGPMGIIISLYALHVSPHECVVEPLIAFKDIPNSMPYTGAFTTHTENILIPHVDAIEKYSSRIIDRFSGTEGPDSVSGDFSFILYPLPKIALCYIFYRADDEFPASATCLFSQNATSFMPLDALADAGEYTSKKILGIAGV